MTRGNTHPTPWANLQSSRFAPAPQIIPALIGETYSNETPYGTPILFFLMGSIPIGAFELWSSVLGVCHLVLPTAVVHMGLYMFAERPRTPCTTFLSTIFHPQEDRPAHQSLKLWARPGFLRTLNRMYTRKPRDRLV